MTMGRPISSTSRASRILAYLQAQPNVPIATREIAEALDLEVAHVTGAIANKLGRGKMARTDEWRHVAHAHHGAWVYRTEAPPMPSRSGDWVPVGEQPDAVVLRGPDGKLWVARPL